MLSEPPEYVWKLLWPLVFAAEVCGLVYCTGRFLIMMQQLPDVFIDTFLKSKKRL